MIVLRNGNNYNAIPKSSIKMIIYGSGEDYIRIVFNHDNNDWRDYHYETAEEAAAAYFSIILEA